MYIFWMYFVQVMSSCHSRQNTHLSTLWKDFYAVERVEGVKILIIHVAPSERLFFLNINIISYMFTVYNTWMNTSHKSVCSIKIISEENSDSTSFPGNKKYKRPMLLTVYNNTRYNRYVIVSLIIDQQTIYGTNCSNSTNNIIN